MPLAVVQRLSVLPRVCAHVVILGVLHTSAAQATWQSLSASSAFKYALVSLESARATGCLQPHGSSTMSRQDGAFIARLQVCAASSASCACASKSSQLAPGPEPPRPPPVPPARPPVLSARPPMPEAWPPIPELPVMPPPPTSAPAVPDPAVPSMPA